MLLFIKVITAMAILFSSCRNNGNVQAKDQPVGDGCEDCEIFYVDMPANPGSHTTLNVTGERGEKLGISGVIFKQDGVTPAPGVIMYLYQANASEYYAPSPNQNMASRKHGRLRSWLKTNEKGEYSFTTIKPGVYPDSSVPAHIHPIIKEPGKSIYYIDDFVFGGEYKVDSIYRAREKRRAGSGIIRLSKHTGGSWRGTRQIVLGLNIPNYRQVTHVVEPGSAELTYNRSWMSRSKSLLRW